MKSHLRKLATVSVLMSTALPAIAGIRARAGFGCTFVTTPTYTAGTDGWIVTVMAYGNPSGTVIVETDTPNDLIERITIVPQTNTGYSSNQLNLSLIVQAYGTSGSIAYLGTVERNGTAGDLWISSIDVAGTIGKTLPGGGHTTITAQAVNLIKADGDIIADITSAGSSQTSGAIDTIQSRGGRILGSISSASSINFVLAKNVAGTVFHTIGQDSTTLTTIHAKDGIGEIAGSSVFANIASNYGGSGNFGRLIANSGPFVGSLDCNSITPFVGSTAFINTGGDLDADVIVHDIIDHAGGSGQPTIKVTGEFKAGRTITVGHSTYGPGTGGNGEIQVASNGLKGQVIIGATNTAEFTCTTGGYFWGGPVVVNSSPTPHTLDPGGCSTTTTYHPYYDDLSGDLGGGAVGVVPFAMHHDDTLPIHCHSACELPMRTWVGTGGSTSRETIIIRHYGPVKVRNISGIDQTYPLTIERVETTSVGGSVDEVTTDYDVAVHSSTNSWVPEREVWISRKVDGSGNPQEFDRHYIYIASMTHASGKTALMSDVSGFGYTDSTAPGVIENDESWPYACHVTCEVPPDTAICPCAADFDGSGGTPDSTDIDAFFAAWLLGLPSADVDCSGGTPDSTDIDGFYSEWLMGGCGYDC